MFNRNKTGELIVKPRFSSRIKLFMTAVFVILILIGGGVIYNYGLSSAGFDSLRTSRTKQGLTTEIRQLRKTSKNLRQDLAFAHENLKVTKAAYGELDQSLKRSERQIVVLREELNFYRNIISPPDKKSGVRIQSLQIGQTDSDNKFRYKLVLIQALKHDRDVYGNASLQIIGLQEGNKTVLDVTQRRQRLRVFRFRYFKDLKGVIKLPANFTPLQIKIMVQVKGRNAKTLEKIFNWNTSLRPASIA